MNYFTQNIRFLRKSKKLTQQQFADKLNVKRSLIGAYEEGRAIPKITVMQQITQFFNISVDDLINVDLESEGLKVHENQKELQILPVVVDNDNRELIPIIQIKASAGYLNGLSDPEYFSHLPVFSMPIPELSRERTYRVFQIKGDSMLPVPSGAYIFCEFVPGFSEMKDGQTYILITKDEGLVFKRIYASGKNNILLVSDNKMYNPYNITADSVLEIWKARGVLSFDI